MTERRLMAFQGQIALWLARNATNLVTHLSAFQLMMLLALQLLVRQVQSQLGSTLQGRLIRCCKPWILICLG